MKILANALASRSLSGQHVLYGHLRQMALQRPEWNIVLLTEPDDDLTPFDLPSSIVPYPAPGFGTNWLSRSLWERRELNTLMDKLDCDLYFTPTGAIVSTIQYPQITYAQNPWCFLREMHHGWKDQLKAFVQRKAYRQAFQNASTIVYLSEHLRGRYQEHAVGLKESDHAIVYVGIADDSLKRASENRRTPQDKSRRMLSVSVMAPWKNIEVVVRMLGELRQSGIDTGLDLVGPWADTDYRTKIERLVSDLGLTAHVEFHGKVDRGTLEDFYASARMFVLPSRCESFGIPAAEAQAFGTPVIGSNTTAMAEVGGEGGCFFKPDDLSGMVSVAQNWLTDDSLYEQMQQAAIENSCRFAWDVCSTSLVAVFDRYAEKLTEYADAQTHSGIAT